MSKNLSRNCIIWNTKQVYFLLMAWIPGSWFKHCDYFIWIEIRKSDKIFIKLTVPKPQEFFFQTTPIWENLQETPPIFGNGIISGKPWQINKNFCDKIHLHTKFYISPFKKIVSGRMCLKRYSATFFCENSLPNTIFVALYYVHFILFT